MNFNSVANIGKISLRLFGYFSMVNEGVNIFFECCHYIGQEKRTPAGNRSKREQQFCLAVGWFSGFLSPSIHRLQHCNKKWVNEIPNIKQTQVETQIYSSLEPWNCFNFQLLVMPIIISPFLYLRFSTAGWHYMKFASSQPQQHKLAFLSHSGQEEKPLLFFNLKAV